LLAVIALGTLGLGGEARASLAPVATLSQSGTQPLVLELGASVGTLVATAPSPTGMGGGVVDVYSELAAGWSSGPQNASLTDPLMMHGPFNAAASGTTVVASGAQATGPTFDDLWVAPASGWSGTLEPTARLVAPGGANLFNWAVISGGTIVAFANSPTQVASALYVFVEPPGGWSGTVAPSAILADSTGRSLDGTAVMSGNTVFAGAGDRVDVFSVPPGGWSGTVAQSATLIDAVGNIALGGVAGNTVACGLSLFREPKGGWSGAVKPVARVYAGPNAGSRGIDAFSGTVALANADSPGTPSPVWLFTEPARGWSQTIAAGPALYSSSNTGVFAEALEDNYLFTTDGRAIHVDSILGDSGHRVGPPVISFAYASGLVTASPHLTFTITAGTNDPPLSQFTLTRRTSLHSES
jgi:hypothetical protein